jgi:hypothetical protein
MKPAKSAFFGRDDPESWVAARGDRDARVYETVICPACTRLHFIDKSTGKTLSSDK